MLLRLLCAVLMMGAFAGPAQAATLFSSTFEGSCGTILATSYAQSYSGWPCTGGPMSVVTSPTFAGSQSLRLNYLGTEQQGLAGGFADFSWGSTSSEIWLTFYNRMDSGFVTGGHPTFFNDGQQSVGTKGLYTFLYSSATGQRNGWSMSYLYGGRQLVMGAQGIKDAHDNSGNLVPYDSEWIRHNIQAYEQPLDAWVCYEVHIRLNTPGVADGLYEQYATNITAGGSAILTSRHQNREFLDSSTSGRMPSDARWYEHKIFRQNGYGSMYYDNIQYTTTRVGCAGAPPTGDTTPPAQVAGLSSPSKTAGSISYAWTANTESDLQQYTIQGCTGAACTNFGTVGTRPAGQNNFTWTGLSANTLYRLRVAAQDTSNNVGSFSSIVDVTTNAATTLPTVTNFATTATGGTITYTGTPTDYRIEFGGNFAGSTNIIRTLAQVPGGVLSFIWPAGTNWACAHARDAVAAEDPIGYRCNSVTASTGGTLAQHGTNGRYFTDASGRAIYLAGMSGTLTEPNATRSALQDFTVTAPTDNFARVDSADLGASWSAGYTGADAFKIVSNGVECSVTITGFCVETHTTALNADQAAEVLIRSWDPGVTEANAQIILRAAAAPTANGYRFRASANATAAVTVAIDKLVAGVWTPEIVTATTPAWQAGDILGAKAEGTTLTMYRNGVPVLTTTDAGIATGGRAGLIVYSAAASTSSVVLDEFYAWNLSANDPTVNDYVEAFDGLVTSGLNYARMWLHPDVTSWGEAAWYAAGGEPRVSTLQLPWLRTGVSTNCTSGTCVMIGRYNLESWNESFFTQVRQRVLAARARGIKLSVMLFEAWGANQTTYHAFSSPFASGNNEQGISCDANANGKCEELHTLSNPNINIYQRAYVRKMIDTLGDLDNIFWEIVNEPNQAGSQAWQEDMASTIRTYEATKGYDHLIMQGPYISPLTASNSYLRASAFEVIQPSCITAENYDTNPPVADGVKIEMYDTDHTGEADMCGTEVSGWPWKTFLRGRHPVLLGERESAPVVTQLKAEMAQTISYANRVNLAAMTPSSGTSIFSTEYGLANACSEYLMYMPTDGSSTINLTACGGTYDVEYLNVTSGAVSSGGTTTGGAVRSFNPSGSDPMVVYLKLTTATDTTPPVISGGQPNGAQPSGTTSVTVTVVTDKASTCKMDSDPNIAYASHDTTFSSTGALLHTQSVGSLSDGTSYARYVRCLGTASGLPTLVDYPITWSVLTTAPALPPANVANVRGTLNAALGTILWQWDAVSGADRYLIEISEGDTFIVAVETGNTATFYQQGNLTVGSYVARVKAVDAANLQSVGWGNSLPVQTSLPPQMTGLTEPTPGAYSNTVILSWTAPTNSSLVSAIERCTGAACTTFAYHGGGNTTGYTDTSVSPGTTYCYRGKFSNPVFGGTSASWSSTYCATTRSVVDTGNGLTRPRTPLPYGVFRLPRN